MRLKVILPVMVAGCSILWVLSTLRNQANPKHPPASAEISVASTFHISDLPAVLDPKLIQATQLQAPVPATPQPPANPPDSAQEKIAMRIAELQDLSRNDDATSLNTIVSEVTNPDADIRKAALEAAKQFGSRDAIPGLRAIAEQATDPELKVEITKTIEFLELPSLTEVLAQSQQKRPTR